MCAAGIIALLRTAGFWLRSARQRCPAQARPVSETRCTSGLLLLLLHAFEMPARAASLATHRREQASCHPANSNASSHAVSSPAVHPDRRHCWGSPMQAPDAVRTMLVQSQNDHVSSRPQPIHVQPRGPFASFPTRVRPNLFLGAGVDISCS